MWLWNFTSAFCTSVIGARKLRWVIVTIVCCISSMRSCPVVCRCDAWIIDCSGKGLSSIPVVNSISVVVNISSNNLTYLESVKNGLPSHSILDLSSNQISQISADFFTVDLFSHLSSLNLSRNSLSSLDFALPPSLRVIKLSYNSLQHFSVNRLKDLTHLTTLYVDFNTLLTVTAERDREERKSSLTDECPFTPLRDIREVSFQGNKLSSLDPSVLGCFQTVQYMSLADNRLRALPAKIFTTFRQLRFLDLSRNHLTSLPLGMFATLSDLKYLSLSGNRLETVPSGLPMIEWLDLSYNAITMVTEQQRSDLYPQEVFLLGGNPLQCDCELLWLKELFDSREYLLKYISIDRSKFVPVCASPSHIRGDTWDLLGDESFGCKGTASKESANPKGNADEQSVIRLDDLSVKVHEVGSDCVTLEWDSLNLLTSYNPAEIVERHKMFISIHPFGKKSEKMSVSVHLTTGRYRLKALHPNTAYVICLSLTDPVSRSTHAKIGRDDCVEIMTKDEDHVGMFLKEHYIQVILFFFIFLLLFIKCCSQSTNTTGSKEKSS